MSVRQIDGLKAWANLEELELRWARRWRDNVAQMPLNAEWRATCRRRLREQALRWRKVRRERRALLGLPDIGGRA